MAIVTLDTIENGEYEAEGLRTRLVRGGMVTELNPIGVGRRGRPGNDLAEFGGAGNAGGEFGLNPAVPSLYFSNILTQGISNDTVRIQRVYETFQANES